MFQQQLKVSFMSACNEHGFSRGQHVDTDSLWMCSHICKLVDGNASKSGKKVNWLFKKEFN